MRSTGPVVPKELVGEVQTVIVCSARHPKRIQLCLHSSRSHVMRCKHRSRLRVKQINQGVNGTHIIIHQSNIDFHSPISIYSHLLESAS